MFSLVFPSPESGCSISHPYDGLSSLILFPQLSHCPQGTLEAAIRYSYIFYPELFQQLSFEQGRGLRGTAFKWSYNLLTERYEMHH